MVKHPAKYTDSILPVMAAALAGYGRVLDPFAGTGKIFELERMVPGLEVHGIEIEPEWCAMNPRTRLGNALDLPWPDGYFDAVATSPPYANRLADHHEARDGSRRNTYRHCLGRPLHPCNGGQLQWGHGYRLFCWRAWREVCRVLRPGGRFVLNISDHIRKGRRVPVSRFHRLLLLTMGLRLAAQIDVRTPRNRYGQNGAARVEAEHIFIFDKKGGIDERSIGPDHAGPRADHDLHSAGVESGEPRQPRDRKVTVVLSQKRPLVGI